MLAIIALFAPAAALPSSTSAALQPAGTGATASPSSAVRRRYDGPFQRPEADGRALRVLTLQNDLVVALVSDNTTVDAATSVDVGVGHFSDLRAQEGLAHFLEHMVFISNAKYPVENSYFAFLAERNGGANAFTASNHTNFYFEVDPDELRGGMDRLANFFISPTFPVNQVGREKHAVDSEHAKNLKNDAWRAAQLLRSLAAPPSVVSKFGTGSLRTLSLIHI